MKANRTMNKPFVHLHVHTTYSILDSTCILDHLCQNAVELGMPALAITDHSVISGAVDFVSSCKRFDIRPIIGCEMHIKGSASLIEGCGRVNQIPPQLAESIFDHIAAFAVYAFLKAHVIACGLVAYQMAYIKAHYPEAFKNEI